MSRFQGLAQGGENQRLSTTVAPSTSLYNTKSSKGRKGLLNFHSASHASISAHELDLRPATYPPYMYAPSTPDSSADTLYPVHTLNQSASITSPALCIFTSHFRAKLPC
jgi:hypothetical protein